MIETILIIRNTGFREAILSFGIGFISIYSIIDSINEKVKNQTIEHRSNPQSFYPYFQTLSETKCLNYDLK